MLKIFLLCGSHTILVFPYPTGWQYSVGNPLPLNANGVVECKGDMKKIAICDQYLASECK